MNEPPKHLRIRVDWKTILLWGGGAGALMGLWWGLWLVGFLVAVARGWLYPGIEHLPEDLTYLRFPTETSLRWLGDVLGMELPSSLSLVLLSVVAVGWAAGAAIAGLGRLLGIDPNLHAWNSLRWSLRGMLSPMVLLLCAIGPGLAGLFWFVDSSSWSDSTIGLVIFGLIAGAMLVFWYVGVPLLVCRSDIAASSVVPHMWRPRWPGWKPAAVFLGLALLTDASGLLEWILESRFGSSLHVVFVAAVASMAWSVLLIAVPLLQCAVLMGVADGVAATWRRFCSWTYLGPYIALGGWWGAAALVVVPPALAAYVWLWKFLPVAASIHESRGDFLPYKVQLVVTALHFFGQFWWVFLAVPLAFAFWLGVSRLLVLMKAPNRR